MNGPSRPRILVIEDETKTARAIVNGLQTEGFFLAWAPTGEDGFFQLNDEPFDALILDWMLPGRSGLEVLKTLRARGCKTPILLLTARDALEDRVTGLDCGADDYLVKPFAIAELAARLRALLRRSAAGSVAEDRQTRWRVADLEVDLTIRRVTRSDRLIDLTLREFDLLVMLLTNSGRIVTRETLAREVWREVRRVTPLDNVIDVHMVHLRRKIDDGFSCRLIHTVRGIGFVLQEEVPE
jgi:DNA-binding response OmpR family regulator